MVRLSQYLFPLFALVSLPLACSSSETPTNNTPKPPPSTGGSGTAGGSGGAGGSMATTGGSGGTGGAPLGGGSSGGSGGGGTVPPGGACTKTSDCQGKGFFCKADGASKLCACPADSAETCGEGAAAVCTTKATDAENCGTCGTTCDPGAACQASVCGAAPTELTKGTGCGSMRLLAKGTDMFWTEKMSGKVMTIPLAGGTATAIATGQLSPTQIVADATALYWIVEGDGTASSSKIMKVALPLAATPAPTALVTSADALPILALAISGGQLYYSHGNDVLAVPVAGGTAVLVGKASNHDMVPPVPSGEPAGIAVAGTVVAWATATRNGVECDDTAPGEDGYKELAESQGEMPLADTAISADGTLVYWATADQLKVATTTLAPPETKNQKLVATTLKAAPITSFAVNATDAYYGTDTNFIFKHSNAAPAEGMEPVPPTVIARDQAKVSAFALDATKVYWATEDCAIRSTGL